MPDQPVGATVEATWAALTQPHSGLTARRHPNNPDVWMALDADGRRHLIVRTDSGETGITLLSVRGLHAEVTRLVLENQPEATWADTVCLDPAMNPTFLAVAADLVAETRAANGDLLPAVRRTLRRWQWFWGVDPAGLSIDAELGLLGEMWFLDRWAPFPEALDVWYGPTGQRHDFTAPTISVEVKATRVRSDGAATHRIANLDQLADPVTGDLHLFSLQAVADPNAANTLAGVIQRVRQRLQPEPDRLALLDRRLAEAHWAPGPPGAPDTAWRIAAEALYRVTADFPRLTRASFPGGPPDGVDNISYTLDLAACRPWKIATHPGQATSLLAALHP